VWWTLPDHTLDDAGIVAADIPGAAHAAEHAAIGLLPLFATCDRWDLGGVSTACHADTGEPTIFVYDGYPGGAGFAEHGYRTLGAWLAGTRAAIHECECESGCPACIQSPKCGNGNNPLDKRGAITLLDLVIDRLGTSPSTIPPAARASGERVALMRDSLLRLTGRDLLDYPGADPDPVVAAFEAPFALVSHDTAPDPVFVYGNRIALTVFELDWRGFTSLPSRKSAEQVERAERRRLLDAVTTNGFIDDYAGVRVASSGRRFTISDAVVWNVTDKAGTYLGQAALFEKWTPIEDGS
jgi:hypothetical protein